MPDDLDDDHPSGFNVYAPVQVGNQIAGHMTLHCALGSDARWGDWCPTHNLPGRYTATCYALTEHGVTVMGRYEGCDCLDDDEETDDE